MSAPHILLVDDEPGMLRYTKDLLEIDHYHVETAASGEEALRRMYREPAPCLIMLDLVMPGMDGLQTLESCKRIRPEQKVLMMSGSNDTSKIVQAIKLGATDCLSKPFQAPELRGAVRRILDYPSPMEPTARQDAPADTAVIENLDDHLFFLAASPSMKRIYAQASLIAKVEVPVLILGESGAGKEVVAYLIHKLSARARRAMVKVNCAALPTALLESELFGYEAGAFTGATSAKPGQFDMANGGTILLDEIGEMSSPLQAKLLHVLQDGHFSRLGGRTNAATTARVLAATNVDVNSAIAEHKLREDLYYRLNAFSLTIPPLRDRREEIPLLLTCSMNSLATQFGKTPLPMSDQLVRECQRYHWPGNLRELGNFVKRYLVLGDENLVVDELRTKCKGSAAVEPGQQLPHSGTGGLKELVRKLKDDAEAREIQRVLEAVAWNRKVAAAELQISYKALTYKIKQYGLVSLSEKRSGASGTSREEQQP